MSTQSLVQSIVNGINANNFTNSFLNTKD